MSESSARKAVPVLIHTAHVLKLKHNISDRKTMVPAGDNPETQGSNIAQCRKSGMAHHPGQN